MKKKILSLMLALSLVLSYMPAIAYADDGVADNPSANEETQEADTSKKQESASAPEQEEPASEEAADTDGEASDAAADTEAEPDESPAAETNGSAENPEGNGFQDGVLRSSGGMEKSGNIDPEECTHENTSTSEDYDWDHPRYEIVDDWNHRVTVNVIENTYCDDCGKLISSEIIDEYAEEQPHNYIEGVCEQCDNGCSHEDTTTDYDWNTETYESIDNASHRVMRSGTETTSCNICGMIVNMEDVDDSEESGHNYNENGVCEDCGHVNDCAHENTNTGFVFDWDTVTYESIDDRIHQVTGTGTETTYCEDCGMVLSSVEEERSEEYAHNYDENGVCENCGHENGCAHEQTYSVYEFDDWDTVTYEPVDNKYHRAIGNATEYTYCSDCGILINTESIEGYSRDDYSHNYDENGVCEYCGYENDCAHEHTEKYSDFHWDTATYESIDNINHRVIGTSTESTYCKDCGMLISSEEVEDGWESGHNYNENGVCEDCGHVNDCAHENTNTEFNFDWDAVTYESVDDRNHQVTGTGTETTTCEDCGMVLSSVEEERSEEFSHNYDEDGVCENCGHVNGCAHENTYTNFDFDWSTVTYEPVDNKYHRVIGTATEYTYCNDCGILVNTEIIEGYSRDDYTHNYNENGVCEDCGHVNDCAHEQTVINSEFDWDTATYEPVDNKYHLVTGTSTESTYCRDCGMLINSEEVEQSEEYTHVYDEDGVCEKCGHVNDCAHENTNTEFNFDWDTVTYESVDDRNHQLTGTGTETTYCEDCGMELSSAEEERSEERSHDYDEDGVCEDCGHVNECTHEDTYTEFEFDGDTVTYEPVDNEYHRVIGTGTEFTYCNDCGMLINTEDVERSEERSHNYNENGVCEDCGYVNDCAHEHTDTYSYFDWDTVTYESVDNRNHQLTGRGIEETYCEDCGMVLSTRELEEYTEERPHVYAENGVCEECGHVNDCEHKHTEESFDLDYDTATYESIDNLQHLVKVNGTKHIYCTDCGIEIGTEEVEDHTYAEGHNYDEDGVCNNCGHVNDCTHEDTYTNFNFDWDTVTYEPVDDRYHIATGSGTEKIYCEECGILLSSEEGVERSLEYSHNYDENGVCEDCGHVNGCAHEYTDKHYAFDWDTVTYEAVDNATHRATGNGTEKTYCRKCGMLINTVEEVRSEEYSHDYDTDGVCETCGHVNTCEHPDTRTEFEYDWDTMTYESIDNKYHKRVGNGTLNRYCNVCGMFVNSEEIEGQSKTFRHGYDENGVCEYCGHVSDCEHQDTYTYFEFDDWDTVTYEPVDDHHHRVTGSGTEYIYCKDCDMLVGSEEVEGSEEESHNFDNNGVCEYCGYVTQCKHEKTYIDEYEFDDDTARYESIDNKYHRITGAATVYKYCEDCDSYIGFEVIDNYSKNYEHNYDRHGVCRDCGHINKCTHENTYKDYEWDLGNVTVTAVDNMYHRVTGTGVEVTWCEDCGAEVSRTPVQINELYEHYYEDGICEECDHINTCEHPATYETYDYNFDTCTVTDSGDGLHHTVTGKVWKEIYCEECNAFLDSERMGVTTIEEDHHFNLKGICNECGARLQGWQKIDGKWYYYGDNGKAKGWNKIDGKWYYFDNGGAMLKNWQKIDGNWYYLDDGAMSKGWKKIDGYWYYFDDGAMSKGWKTVDGKMYYFDDGAMSKGWKTIGGKTYYFDDGAMVKGWQKLDGKWYYFDDSGVMLKDWQKIDGKWYYLDNGVMLKNWQKIDGNWYYFDDGAMLKGWQKLDGYWYYFDDGAMSKGWKKIDGKWYYFDDGAMSKGWKKIDSKWYYFDDGAMVIGTRTIDGKSYTFDNSGAWTGK